ncbi:MAG: DUF4035 domain-containing protein [Sphingomonas sp.]|nr:DUF4035 domain-containing protein [Sphingomonas sp.]
MVLGLTVDELGARMSAREFVAWQVFAAREPFGEARGDLQAAHIASVIANVNRDPKSRPQPFTARDFLLDFDAMWDGESADEPTAEEQADNAARLMARMAQTREAYAASR